MADGTDLLSGIEAHRAVVAEREAFADLAERVRRLESLVSSLMFYAAEHIGAAAERRAAS